MFTNVDGTRTHNTLLEWVSENWWLISHKRPFVDIRVYHAATRQRVSEELLEETMQQYRVQRHKSWIDRFWGHPLKRYTFRNGPVPGTSGKDRRRGRYAKNPRNIQELRYNADWIRPGRKIEIRAFWDEYDFRKRSNISWGRSATWKNNSKRKKQWMV